MIKVNLLYDQSVRAAAVQESVGLDVGKLKALLNMGPGASGNIIFVVAMLVVPLGVLTAWEQWNLNSLRTRYKEAQKKESQIATQLESKKKEASQLNKFRAKAEGLKTKIGFVRKLSYERLPEIKALDKLQDIIPAQVWLKSFNCSDGKFQMNGVALSEERLHEFVGRLDEVALFQGVLLEFFDRSQSGKEKMTSFRIKGRIVAEKGSKEEAA